MQNPVQFGAIRTLAEVINAWAGLPGALRAAILAMIRTGW